MPVGETLFIAAVAIENVIGKSRKFRGCLIWETVPDSKINLPLDLTAEFEKRHGASRRRALTEMLCLRRRGHLPMLRRP